MIKNRRILYLFSFLAVFVSPQPFLCFASFLGLLITLKFSKLATVSRKSVVLSIAMASTVLISAKINETSIDYEEKKRLIGLVASSLNFVFLQSIFSKFVSDDRTRQRHFLLLSTAFLCSTYFWYIYKIEDGEGNYSWLKYYGVVSVSIFLAQISRISILRRSNNSILWLGSISATLFYLDDAKSASIIVISGSLILRRFAFSNRALGSMSHSRTESPKGKFLLAMYFMGVFFLFSFLWNLGFRGFLGARVQSNLVVYGPSIISSLFDARPELRISLNALKSMPWYGFGTPSDGMGFALGTFADPGEMTMVNVRMVNLRVLGEGLNVHSWFFEMLLRGGFITIVVFIPLVILLFRVIINPANFSNYPGLYMVSLFTTFDLFFSPFTWFSPIQLAFALLAGDFLNNQSRERYSNGNP